MFLSVSSCSRQPCLLCWRGHALQSSANGKASDAAVLRFFSLRVSPPLPAQAATQPLLRTSSRRRLPAAGRVLVRDGNGDAGPRKPRSRQGEGEGGLRAQG